MIAKASILPDSRKSFKPPPDLPLHITAPLLHFAKRETPEKPASFARHFIVGYNTVNVSDGQFIALAVQFEDVAQGSVAINDLVTVGSPAGGNTLGGGADQIWLWDAATSSWVKYFRRIQRGTDYGWCREGETTATTDTVSTGATVFFYRGGSTTTPVTLSGAVKEKTGVSSASVSDGQFVFMSYPWPVALGVNSFSKYQTVPAGGNTLGGGADQIWLWDASKSSWVKYFHRIQRGTDYGWCREGETAATEDAIPVGSGFFFYRGGSTTSTITFTAPKNLP